MQSSLLYSRLQADTASRTRAVPFIPKKRSSKLTRLRKRKHRGGDGVAQMGWMFLSGNINCHGTHNQLRIYKPDLYANT